MKGTRRDFFKIAGAASVVAAGGQAVAGALPAPKANPKAFTGGRFPRATRIAKGRVLGANDRVLIGHIGVGGMGTAHVRNFKQLSTALNTQSIAVCDPYSPRIERAKSAMLEGEPEGRSILAEKDYRRILDDKDVDAVVIATPEHWHCQISVHAL